MARHTLSTLQALVQTEEEGSQLDYKVSEWLSKDKVVKICKTVSAFANSNGGLLVVGVDDNHETRQFDAGIDPFVLEAQLGTEPELWLRQILTSHLQPRLAPPDIYWVDHPDNQGRKLLLIDMAQTTNGPHQLNFSSDKGRYWYRNGSENKEMEDWQIRDVMNRKAGPQLELDFRFRSVELVGEQCLITLYAPIVNYSQVPADYVDICLYVGQNLQLQWVADRSKPARTVPDVKFPTNLNHKANQFLHSVKPEVPILHSNPFHWPWGYLLQPEYLTFQALSGRQFGRCYLHWELRSHRMTPRYGVVILHANVPHTPTLATLETGLIINGQYIPDA
jgi:Putative DNA-binding domain